jgi:hypothetical protein
VQAFSATADCWTSACVRSAASRIEPAIGEGGHAAIQRREAGQELPLRDPHVIGARPCYHRALSHSFNFDQRRRPDTLRTAIATAFL